MPILSNPKHERLAQGLAKGMTQEAAYENAGFSPHRSNAARLIANDSIKARVAELQGKAAEKAVVTAESLILEAEEIRRQALAAGQYSAAVAAVREKGVLAGVRVEKRSNETKISFDDMTDEQLIAYARSGVAEGVAAPINSPVSH